MNAKASFGEWLKQRRKALDLTQDELARRVVGWVLPFVPKRTTITAQKHLSRESLSIEFSHGTITLLFQRSSESRS